jgi:hypothetical protein
MTLTCSCSVNSHLSRLYSELSPFLFPTARSCTVAPAPSSTVLNKAHLAIL